MNNKKPSVSITKNDRQNDLKSQNTHNYRRQRSHGQSSESMLQDDCLSPLLNFKLSFDFDFEFDKTDEMSSLKKKVKTEDEINKCAVNEDFTPLQKAIFIMKKGYEVQKKCVVSNLEQYVCSDFASNNELLPLILNSIESWDTEFQCLLAQSLGRTTEKSRPGSPTISSANLQKAIKLCLDFIDNLNNNDVHQSWSQIFQKLAFELNFIDPVGQQHRQQQQFLQETVYAKILLMIDRKQEKRRRLRGSKLFFDLMATQNSTILTSKEHKKIFMVLQSDTNFFYRADMAESLGIMILKKEQFLQQQENVDGKSTNTNINLENLPKVTSFEQFQSFYLDDFIDLINDSDNLVSLKALQSIAKLLTDSDFIQKELFLQNIKPQLIKMIKTVVDDEENLILFSQIFGEIIYSFNEKFSEEINDIANEICNFFQFCCNYQKEPQIRENAAFNFPCIFNIFCMNQELEIDFAQCLFNLTKIDEEQSTRIIIGQQIHEIYSICYREQLDIYFVNRAFVQIIKSDLQEVKLSVLNQLSKSVNFMNLYFKNEIIKDLWEPEKFSLKEASVDVETEKYSLQIQETSHGIASIMHSLTENSEHIKNWREIKIYLEQIIQIIDCQQFIQEIQNKKLTKQEMNDQAHQNYSSLQQQLLIQYFQLNFLCGQLFEITFNILLQGANPLRHCSLKLLCQFVINIASSVKRQEYFQKIRENFFFEKTKASWKQIIYLEFCNSIMPFVSLKFVKQQILPDLLKHAQYKRTDLKGVNESNLQNKTKIYFIKNSIQLINEYCAYQDEELALNLMAIIDGFKNIEFNENIDSINDQPSLQVDEVSSKIKNKKKTEQAAENEDSKKQLLKQMLKQKLQIERQIQEISDAAFWIDDNTSYNLASNQSEAMKKKFQRIEMLKLQREKRLGIREQFELEHFDSSLIGYDHGDYQALMSIERRQSAGDNFDIFNMNQMQGKNKYKKISGKYTINGLKKQKTTFGITRRFDPEPGSIYSQSQQKVLNNFKKTSTMGINGVPNFPNATSSTAQMQIFTSNDGTKEQNIILQEQQQNQIHQTSQSLPKKPLKNTNRIGTIGRQQSKSQKKRIDIRTFEQDSQQQYKMNMQKFNTQLLSPNNNSQQNSSDNQIDSSANGNQAQLEELKIFQQQQYFQDNYDIQKNMLPEGSIKQIANSFKVDKISKYTEKDQGKRQSK